MFYFAGYARGLLRAIEVHSTRFPHSEIPGSQVATHLPETYRRYAASFIAFSSLGIHHSPLMPTIPMLTCFVIETERKTGRPAVFPKKIRKELRLVGTTGFEPAFP